MIKQVVFDIGNVCVTFRTIAYFSVFFNDEEKAKRLCEHIFMHPLWRSYDQGLITKEALEVAFLEQLNDDPEDILAVLKHWKNVMNPIPSTKVLMQELKTMGIKLYVLSNINQDSADYIKAHMPFYSCLDGSLLSYEEKLIKPDRRIYERLLAKYNLLANECLFIDDIAENIQMAQQVGMQGIIYHDEKQVYADVLHILQEENGC